MTDQSIRYGAFFKCSGEKIIETTKDVVAGCTCQNGHHFTSSFKFCPECTAPCDPTTKTVTKKEEFSPCFWEDDELVHVESKASGHPVYYYFTNLDGTTWQGFGSEDESEFVELPLLETLKANLESNPMHAEFIDRLHQKYENVEVVTGMLVDCDR